MSEPVKPSAAAPAALYMFAEELTKKHKQEPAKAVEEPTPPAAEDETFAKLKASLPSLLFGDKLKEPEKKEEKVEDKKEDKVEDKPNEPEKKEDKKEDKPAKGKKLDPYDLIKAQAEETGRAISEALRTTAPQKDSPPPANEDLSSGLSEEDKDNFEAFVELSQSNPAYKTHPQKFLRFVKQLESYKSKWEKEHTGESFDASAEEHEDFYSTNMPTYKESDLDRARIRLEAKKITQDHDRKFQEELERVRNEALAPQIQQEAFSMADSATGNFVSGITDDAIKAVIKEKGADGLKEADPIVYKVLNELAYDMQQQVVEIHNIARRTNYYDPSNPVHKSISVFASEQEQRIKSLPLEHQIFEGKKFATRAEMTDMTPAQRKSFWALGENDLVNMLVAKNAALANRAISSKREEFNVWAERYGFKKAPATQGGAKPSSEAAAATKKVQSPSGSEGGPLPPTQDPAKKDDGDIGKKLVNSLF